MIGVHEISGIIAERALNSIPAGLAIAGLAWLGLRAFNKDGSGVRFSVWFLALLGIAAVPFVPTLAGSRVASNSAPAGLTISGFWADCILALWAAVVMLIALRLLLGIWKLWRLKRQATPINISDLPAETQGVIAEFRRDRSVRVCVSTRVRVPTAVGFFKPTVLLPEWALADLSEKDLSAVILHELAHLRRKDDWTNLTQKVLGAFFFFHPAIWWVERRLALEREMACDELVLAETGNRQAYAECLVSLAEKSFARRSLALAHSAIGHARSTALRLTRILDPGQASRPGAYSPTVAVASAAFLFCMVLAPGTPHLVAFEEHATAQKELPRAEVAKAMPDLPVPAATEVATSFRPAQQKGVEHGSPARAQAALLAHKKTAHTPEILARRTDADAIAGSRTQFVLVVQTRIDGDGEVKTKFCVWKLTLRESDNWAIRAQIVSSSL